MKQLLPILTLVQSLKATPWQSADQLADRFGVSKRYVLKRLSEIHVQKRVGQKAIGNNGRGHRRTEFSLDLPQEKQSAI